MAMPKLQKSWTILNMTILPGIVIALHAYLGSFTRLLADDYCSLYNARALGVLGTAWFWYRTWAGVYARSLINEILLWIGPYTMWVIVPGVLILWLLATAWVLYLLVGNEMPPKGRIWLSIGGSITLIFAVLLISPRLVQSLYWWGGMSAYTIPLMLATFCTAVFLVVSRREWDRKTSIAWSALSFIIAFGLGGISESFTPILIVFLALLASWGGLTKRFTLQQPPLWFLGTGLAGSILALIVVVAAPGNAIRATYFPPHPGLIEIFQIAGRGYIDFLYSTIAEPQKSAGLLGVWLGSILLGMGTTNPNPPKSWTAPAILALGIFLAFLCFPPSAYGTSTVPPGRVLIISAYLLAAGLMISGYMAGKWLLFRRKGKHAAGIGFLISATLLVGYSAWVTSRSLYESRIIFMDFAHKWDQVDALILDAKNNEAESVTIPAMINWANLDRPNDNPKFWATDCYSDYYGIQVYGPPYE
jgi:hypothetical protein